MKKAEFDFGKIDTVNDFYIIAKKKLDLPDYFGNNMDALWDSLTGHIELPVAVRFKNMSMHQLESFEEIIRLMEEASDELGADFSFEYYLRKTS